MMFSMVLVIDVPGLPEPVEHTDMIQARSLTALLKLLDITNKQACDIKNYGFARWRDCNRVRHTLHIKHEAN